MGTVPIFPRAMRVIAGIAKGMPLKVPHGHTVRPTSDMVREAIFDILGETPVGARVLDLFAGTGALAIEALSRGAEHAVLIERSARCMPVIRENLDKTGFTGRATVIHADVYPEVRKLDAAAEQFDLVLADPPYTARVDRQGPGLRDFRRAKGGPPYISAAARRHGGRGHVPVPAQKALQLLADSGILPENAVLVLEHAAGLTLPEEAGRLRLTTTRKYGSTSVSIYRTR